MVLCPPGLTPHPKKTSRRAPMATVEMTDQRMSEKGDKASERMAEQKHKALGTALSQIERSYGKGAIMRMGEGGVKAHVEAISTGALNLDAAIGIGGVPRGRI